jgi:hypothetical protein
MRPELSVLPEAFFEVITAFHFDLKGLETILVVPLASSVGGIDLNTSRIPGTLL